MTVGRKDVKRHPLDTKFDEQRSADMGDAPELQLAGADLHAGIQLAIDRDDPVTFAEFDMLDEEKSLGQALQERKELLRVVNDKTAGHPA